MKQDTEEIRKSLKRKLAADRYEHTIGVCYTAVCLAMRYGVDLHRAELAGLLHDCAKYGSDEKKLEHCIKYKIPVTPTEQKNPSLLHAKLGAYYAKERYGVTDEEILSAIACHTTGKEAMTTLEKIVFVADYIEPNRDKAPNLSSVRELAFLDLDRCVLQILQDTLVYLAGRKDTIDPETERVCHYYEQQLPASSPELVLQQASGKEILHAG